MSYVDDSHIVYKGSRTVHHQRLEEEQNHYYDRYNALTHQGIVYSISFILVAQFMAFNFDYLLGSIITIISVCAITTYVIFNIVEGCFLYKGKLKELKCTIRIHNIIILCVILVYMPFLIWATVLMFRRGNIQ